VNPRIMNRPISVYHFPRGALTLSLSPCMGIQPGARFPAWSADVLPATLYGHFTQEIYRHRPIKWHPMSLTWRTQELAGPACELDDSGAARGGGNGARRVRVGPTHRDHTHSLSRHVIETRLNPRFVSESASAAEAAAAATRHQVQRGLFMDACIWLPLEV
jgi:hypothetical protein